MQRAVGFETDDFHGRSLTSFRRRFSNRR